MESLFIAQGIYTPEIRFDPVRKSLIISGKSFPADPVPFYNRVFDWLNDYLSDNKNEKELYLSFQMEYYNTSSSKQFAKLFKVLENCILNERVAIKWFYTDKDTDMMEAGFRFSQITNLRFEILKIQSN